MPLLHTGLAALVLAAGGTAAVVGATAAPAFADAKCTGNVSVYGVLADGRLTYTAIDPDNGNIARVVTSTVALPFMPKAIATLNFNTILVTTPGGELRRIDVGTNSTALNYTLSDRIEGGWTHDLLTYDGRGHLYGVADGHLLQYLVSRDKPGADQIGQRKEIGSGGFTLKTLAATGDDRITGTTATGKLITYTIPASGPYTRAELDDAGWQSFESMVSPGGGLYYGKNAGGAMYWYEDRDPNDGSGADIEYHLNDPVASRGWTQKLLSAQPNTCITTVAPTSALRSKIAELANGEIGTPESKCDKYHPSCDAGDVAWCAMFATWTWYAAGVSGVPRNQWYAQGLGQWGVDHDLFKSRSGANEGSPKIGDWVIYGTPGVNGGGHVDVIVSVRPDGTLATVGGNLSDRVTMRKNVNPDTARGGASNYPISGYVSPPGA